jgi:flagellar export protein FliJ
MQSFRFRAEAALAVRRRHDEVAQRALGVAQGAMLVATQDLTRAQTAIREADGRARTQWETASGIEAMVWHRNWMVGLERNVARARSVHEERRIEERRAAEIAREARTQVRVLELLKERLLRVWQLEVLRAEQKALDELASLRFASRLRAAQEDSR